MPKINSKKQFGFTLIEILVVIGILAVLLTLVLIAINPTKNTQDARNTKRKADVLAILDAVNQYYVANNGSYPTGTPAPNATASIKSSVSNMTAFCNALVDTYIAALPVDPQTINGWTDCSTYDTGYTIKQTSSNRITISAPQSTSDGASSVISVTR